MTGGKKEIKERIKRIAHKQKMMLVTFVAVILIAIIIVMSAFGSATSVMLIDAAGNFTLENLESVEYIILTSDNKVINISKVKAREITNFIKKLRVNKKEVNKVLENYRDSTNQIHLVYSGFAGGEQQSIYFNFNKDFSQVWVDNEVKPSLSYAVKKPKEVKAFFKRQFESTIAQDFEADSAEKLWNARTKYVGNNSAVGKLIGLLPAPEDVRYDHFELHTGEQPYGVEIVYSVTSGVLNQYAEEIIRSDTFHKNALVILALIDNADRIYTVLTDGKRKVVFTNTREWADSIIGEDVRNYAESPEKLKKLIAFPITTQPLPKIVS